jgi:hypothetical protein
MVKTAVKKKVAEQALLLEAAGLNKREVQQLGFDPLVAKRACRKGLEFVDEHQKGLARDHRGFDLAALRELPELCDLVLQAQRDTQRLRKRGGDVLTELNTALAWRRRLLGLAQSLSEAGGSVDPRELRKIETGKGSTDNVQDVLDLAALLAPVKAAVDAAHGADALTRAQAAASAALFALGGTGAETPESRKAAERRDRLATLVVLRHDRLRVAVAAVTSFREAASLVPALQQASAASRSVEDARPTPQSPSDTSQDRVLAEG